jgi:hypothetical protein
MAVIDLDELERKARAVISGLSCHELRLWHATYGSDVRRWRDGQLQSAAKHIAANDPTTTLALIARIRELEAGLTELVDDLVQSSEDPDGDYGDVRALVAKGAVTP